MANMTKEDREAYRRNLDAPRWKCVACGHMERGHLTSSAQGGRACPECGERHHWTGSFVEAEPQWNPRGALRDALDTIDKREAERDQWRMKVFAALGRSAANEDNAAELEHRLAAVEAERDALRKELDDQLNYAALAEQAMKGCVNGCGARAEYAELCKTYEEGK